MDNNFEDFAKTAPKTESENNREQEEQNNSQDIEQPDELSDDEIK